MNSWFKRVIILFCFIAFMSNSMRVEAKRSDAPQNTNKKETVIVSDSLVATVSYGYNQEARYGRFATMQIDVYNKGETFEGSIHVVLINENQDNIDYSTKGLFVGGEKSEFHLALPMNRASKEMVFRIENQESKTVVEKLIPLNVTNLGDYCYVGILSDNSIQLSYFEYFGNKLVNMDKDNLSSDYLTYDVLDLIVIDQFDLDRLGASQLTAILDWVRKGGTLVLGIDENYLQNVEVLEQYGVIHLAKEVDYEISDGNDLYFCLLEDREFTKHLTEIRNYEAARSQVLKEIENSKALGNVIKDNVYVGNSMLGTLSLNDITQTYRNKSISIFSIENSKNRIYKNENYLYETVDFGAGTVQIFHFGLGNPEITKEKLNLYENAGGVLLNSFYSSIVMTSLNHRSPAAISRIHSELFSDNQDYRVNNIGRYPEIGEVPKVGGYIVVISIYLIVIGPVLSFVLWKIKKQKRVWTCIPILTLVFMGIMFSMGSSTRIKEAYAGYINIEYADESMNRIEGKSYASIILTNRFTNHVVMKPADSIIADAHEFPSYYSTLYQTMESNQKFYDYDEAATEIMYTKEGIELKFYKRPAFMGELFELNYHKPYEDIIHGEVVISEHSITGELQNQSGYDLTKALLCVNGYYVELGDIKEGDKVLVQQNAGVYASNIETLMYTKNPVSAKRGFQPEQSLTTRQSREIESLSFIYSKYLKDSQSAYLVAFTEEVPSESPIANIASRKASYGVSAIVARVNLKSQEPLKKMITNLDLYMESDNEYAWDQSTRFAYTNSIEFAYRIPRNKRVERLFLSDLFNDFNNQTEVSELNCSRIYLYNFDKEKYDLIFDLESEYGSRSIDMEELSVYLNVDHELKVRYENGSSTAQDIFTVPILSCFEEDIDATD